MIDSVDRLTGANVMPSGKLLTQAEWAKQQGFSKQYANKLVKSGRIKLADGKIDPFDAERRMGAGADVLRAAQRAAQKRPARHERRRAESRSCDLDDVAVDEIPAERLGDQLLRARIKREREEGRLKELERKKREGELIDALEVRAQQTRRATEERDALLNLPARIGSSMAADLGMEERLVVQTLRKYIRQHLAERSSQPIARRPP
jgi:hypothetical protein